jgi:hypothetical protein
MARIRKMTASKTEPLADDNKIQGERQRIAEHLVLVLRGAGYPCRPADGDSVGGLATLPIDAKIH